MHLYPCACVCVCPCIDNACQYSLCAQRWAGGHRHSKAKGQAGARLIRSPQYSPGRPTSCHHATSLLSNSLLCCHPHHLHIAHTHTHTHTHSVYWLWQLSSFSSAGVSTRESSKAQLCRTGKTLSSQRDAKIGGTFKGKQSCLNFTSCVQRFDLRNLKRPWKAVQQRFAAPQNALKGLRFFLQVLNKSQPVFCFCTSETAL